MADFINHLETLTSSSGEIAANEKLILEGWTKSAQYQPWIFFAIDRMLIYIFDRYSTSLQGARAKLSASL
jgi:hypothetical protein